MSKKEKPDEELFYMENGLIVFTEAYHLRRGYCCNSGCRHCPYGGPLKRGKRSRQDESGRDEK